MMKGLFAGVLGLGAVGLTALQLSSQSGPDTAPGPAPTASVDAGAATQGPPLIAPDAGTPAGSRPPPRSRAAAVTDGGALYIGDPPGRLTTADGGGSGAGGASAADAGAGSATGVDAGADASSSADELRRVRERVAALEQELARARSDAQAQQVEQLDQLNRQVAVLREQLAQEQARRQAEQNAAQQARVQEQQAVTALSTAQQQLAIGDSRVIDTLQSAAGALPPPAQRAVETARSAVQSGDLSAARYWLSVAIAQTQQAEIKR